MGHVSESGNQSAQQHSFKPNLKILQAKSLWPEIKQKQKTEAKMKGFGSMCKEKRKDERDLAQYLSSSPWKYDIKEGATCMVFHC